jgi:hypothetical protein
MFRPSNPTSTTDTPEVEKAARQALRDNRFMVCMAARPSAEAPSRTTFESIWLNKTKAS